jgi:cyclic pyranopterin phosphate synthase
MCSEYSSSAIRNESHGIVIDSVYNDNFIESITEFIPHLQEARFSGGEPFMNEIYFKLWDKLIELNPNCKIFIQTNGTLLNSKIKSLLEIGNFYINVSVDALNPVLYSEIRRNASIDKTISNIAYFADYSLRNNRKFGITACAMKDNIQEWADLVNFANKYKAFIWFSEVYFPFVNALWLMTNAEIEKNLEKLKTAEILIVDELDQHNANLYYNLVAKLEETSHSFKEKEHRKQFIPSEKLVQKLESLFSKSILSNPSTWQDIVEIFDTHRECLFYDFTDKIIDQYNSEFVYNHLSMMTVAEMRNNFRALILK